MILSIRLAGQTCIFLSLASSLFGIAAVLLYHKTKKEKWLQGARVAAYLNFFAMTLANLAMIDALLTNDFSVSYVAQVGAKETPRFFAAISLWSSLEGSILFWGWILSFYTALCVYRYRNGGARTNGGARSILLAPLMPWVSLTLLSIGLFFYAVLAFPANPFRSVFPVPDNGPGPNPLLQNHWLMAIHPPMLYLGYVGMSVPFAFAIASVVTGELNDSWVRMTRKWFLTAWMFLSAAIILGGWWSYAVLGWGGYWAWDPVENASFMPWLTGTALIHSMMVEEKRGGLKIWNLFLMMTTFLLTILGTFLTRSGILDSVHSFTESDLGHYFLMAIGCALLVSVGLLIWRGERLKSEGGFDHPFSRETFLLINNLLLICFCFVVLLGTMYPLILEALRGVKITVGEPFFNQMTTPLALLLILLMGVGVLMPWKKGDLGVLSRKMLWPLFLSAGVLALAYYWGVRKILVLLSLTFASFAFFVMFLEMAQVFLKTRTLFSSNPRRYGGFVVHMGIVLIAMGVALSKNYQQEKQVTIRPGETFEIGSYKLQLDRLFGNPKPQRFEVIALLSLSKKGNPMGFLDPRLNFYLANREPIGSPAVHSSIKEDLYLTLMAFEHHDFQVTLRAIVTPAVSWIWVGGGIVVVGVLIAVGLQRKETPYCRDAGI